GGRRGRRQAGGHALPAAVELHRPGRGAGAGGRPDRPLGRERAGPGAGGEGLRRDREGGGSHAMIAAREGKDSYLSSFPPFEEGLSEGRRSPLRRLRRPGAEALARRGLPPPTDEGW